MSFVDHCDDPKELGNKARSTHAKGVSRGPIFEGYKERAESRPFEGPNLCLKKDKVSCSGSNVKMAMAETDKLGCAVSGKTVLLDSEKSLSGCEVAAAGDVDYPVAHNMEVRVVK